MPIKVIAPFDADLDGGQSGKKKKRKRNSLAIFQVFSKILNMKTSPPKPTLEYNVQNRSMDIVEFQNTTFCSILFPLL